MTEISCALLGGPYSGNAGRLSFKDEPPKTLAFTLDSETNGSGLIVPSTSSVSDKLTVTYVLVHEKPRKVMTYENGRARSELGVRYRYDPKLSPAEALFQASDADALLEASARDLVDGTRKLLLADANARALATKRDVETIGDLRPKHRGRLVSVEQGEPKRYGGQRRDFRRDGGVVVELDGRDVELLVDTAVLLLDERELQ